MPEASATYHGSGPETVNSLRSCVDRVSLYGAICCDYVLTSPAANVSETFWLHIYAQCCWMRVQVFVYVGDQAELKTA